MPNWYFKINFLRSQIATLKHYLINNCMKNDLVINIDNINECIYFIRGHKVMLDRDLAMLYGIKTKALKQAVKRNIERFPHDFMFELSKEELENWRSQFVTSNLKTKMGLRRKPYAFTEHGVAMLSSVLRSKQSTKINIQIIRVFIKLRHILSEHKNLSKKIEELQSFVLKNSHQNDKEFRKVWNVIKKLMTPPDNQTKIGFNLGQ